MEGRLKELRIFAMYIYILIDLLYIFDKYLNCKYILFARYCISLIGKNCFCKIFSCSAFVTLAPEASTALAAQPNAGLYYSGRK